MKRLRSTRVEATPQIVALSSITMRICGGVLSVGLGGVAGASLVGADVPALAMACSCFPAKFAVAFPLVYHYAGAVRHTLWDRQPETMLNNKDAEQSSYLWLCVDGFCVLMPRRAFRPSETGAPTAARDHAPPTQVHAHRVLDGRVRRARGLLLLRAGLRSPLVV